MNTEEYLNKVVSVSLGFYELGVREGDKVAIHSENRPEWFISDLAIMLSGGITVPAYTTYTEEDYRYLIEDCEPSFVIVDHCSPLLESIHNDCRES